MFLICSFFYLIWRRLLAKAGHDTRTETVRRAGKIKRWDSDGPGTGEHADIPGQPGVAWYRGELPEMSWTASCLLPARRPTRCRSGRRQADGLYRLCWYGHRAHPASHHNSACRPRPQRLAAPLSRGDMDGFEIPTLRHHDLSLLGQLQTGDKCGGPCRATPQIYLLPARSRL